MNLTELDPQLLTRAMVAGGGGDAFAADYLVRRRLADRVGAAVVLREAAVLLFAQRPETILHPNAGICVFRVAGTERLTGARHSVQEFPRIEGNLPAVLAQVRALLETLIQRSARLRDRFFQDMPEYPTFAWQEAIVNVIAHRDYAIISEGSRLFPPRNLVPVPPSPHYSPRRRLRPSRRGHLVAYGRFSLVKYVQYYPRCASGRAPRSASRRLVSLDVVVNNAG